MDILSQLKELDNKLTQRIVISESNATKLEEINNALLDISKDVKELEDTYKFVLLANDTIKDIAYSKHEANSRKIEETATQAVKYVVETEQHKSLKIKNRKRKNEIYAKLLYYNEDNKDRLYNLKICSGSGYRQTASFVAIATIISLANTSPFIFTDECFKGLDNERTEKLADILTLLTNMGLQLIYVEHGDVLSDCLKHREFNLVKEGTRSKLVSVIDKDVEGNNNEED